MQEIDIRELFNIFIVRLKWIILFAVLGAAIAGVYAEFCIEETYTSSFTMYVNSSTATDRATISSSSIGSAQELIKEYSVILRDEAVASEVSKVLRRNTGTQLSAGAVSGCFGMGAVNDTAMFRVSATTTDPQLSKDLCEAMIQVAPGKLKEIMGLSNVTVMTPPKDGVRSLTNNRRLILIGAAIGAVLTYGLFVVLYLMDNTVRDTQDLKRRLNVTVLGEVPSIQAKKGGKQNHG